MGFLDRLKLLKDAPLNNDVSTTPEDPPEFRACAVLPANAQRDLTWNGRRHILISDEPLDPLHFELPATELFDLVVETANAQSGWSIISADRDSGRVEAVATTNVLRFKDDVVIEIRDSVVHVRSKSRLGRKDFGANESRIREYLAQLQRAVQARS